jgi:hypothetical protein
MVQALLFDNAKDVGAPRSKQVPRRWKINDETVVFYFELAGALEQRIGTPSEDATSGSPSVARVPNNSLPFRSLPDVSSVALDGKRTNHRRI